MTQQQKADRQKRAQTLVDLVSKAEGGYRVASSRDPNVAYFVSKPNGRIVCTCSDFEKHSQEDSSWKCKHIESVILAHKLGKLNGSSSTPAAEPRTPVQDPEETPVETEVSEEETVRLEPCMSCGVKLAVDELIPVQVPSGFGLVCRDCFGPPSRSCGYCGEKFPTDELIPVETKFGPVLSCEICQNEIMASKVAVKNKAGQPEAPGALTLAHAHPALTKPFPMAQVEVKPGAVSNGKALALAYVDMRAYQVRLDEVVGPDGWSVGYRALGVSAVICRLTVLGISREDVGEADPEDANAWTSAVAQSFKRACASFGLGRYLYSLPRLWAEYDPQKKALKAPQTIVERMYQEARL